MPATPRKFRVDKTDLELRKLLRDPEHAARLQDAARLDGFYASQLAGLVLPEPEWIIPGWLVDGMSLLVSGQPKSFKSTLLFELALSLAYGEPFLGLYEVRADPTPVMYLQEENTIGDMRRHVLETEHRMGFGSIHTIDYKSPSGNPLKFKKWTPSGKERPAEALIKTRTGFMVTDDQLALLKDHILREGTKWVFLDPLYKIMPPGMGGLNSDEAVQALTVSLDQLAEETKANIIMIHHQNKDKGSTGGHKVFGSNLIWAWGAQTWWLKRDKDIQLKGETVRKINVEADFRSLAPQWQSKDLLYSGWAAWKEAGEHLPGESRTGGRPVSTQKSMFTDWWDSGGKDKDLSQRQIAKKFDVSVGSISKWLKSVAEDPETL